MKTKGSGTLRWLVERGTFPVRKVGVVRLGSLGRLKQRAWGRAVAIEGNEKYCKTKAF